MKSRKLLLNVSLVALSLACFALGTAYAAPGDVPDLTKWVDTWFKITLTANVYHYSNIGVKPSPSYQVTDASPAYMKITGWVPATRILQANVYVKEAGVWSPDIFLTLDMTYFAGDALKFVCSSFLDTGDMQNGFILFFKGKLNTKGNFILGGETNLKSLGGYYLEIDDVPESTERWAGSATITGNMIPLSKVPPALLVP